MRYLLSYFLFDISGILILLIWSFVNETTIHATTKAMKERNEYIINDDE